MTTREESNTLVDLIRKQHGFCKVAEVGVWKSRNLKWLLRKNGSHISEFWGIDTFEVNIPSSSGRENLQTPEFWKEQYLHACRLMRFFPQLHIVKTTSIIASQLFDKPYFDLVFLDAGHQYPSVIEDINAWFPLVKEGGFLSGHDYEKDWYPDVKIAVDEIFGDRITIVDTVWFIKKMEDFTDVKRN